MVFRVRDNIRQVQKSMRYAERTQVPFAAALSLTNTAKFTRLRVINRIFPRAFNTAKRSFPRALYRFEKATKRVLISRVTQVLDRDYMELHERGGQRTAHHGGRIAVPVNVRRTKTGRLTKASKPRGIKGGFVADFGRGEGIWSEKRDGRLVLHFSLKRAVHTPRRYPLEAEGYRYAERIWPTLFKQSIERALRTKR